MDGWNWLIPNINWLVAALILILVWCAYKFYNEKKGKADEKCILQYVIFSVLDFTLLAILLLHTYFKQDLLILPVVGIASFCIPLLLSFCDEYNLGTRLDNGEVRKSIAISFTVVYLIMLSLFFFSVTIAPHNSLPGADIPQIAAASTMGENSSDALEKVPNAGKAAFVLPLFFEATSTMRSQGGDTTGFKPDGNPSDETASQTLDKTKSTKGTGTDAEATESSGNNDSQEKQTEATGENNQQETGNSALMAKIPDEALKDIFVNFLYVYIIIIGFYFGSRVFEDFAGVKMAKELKDFDPVDLLRKRYVMGEISTSDYSKRIAEIQRPFGLEISFNVDKNLVRITNLGGQKPVGKIENLVIDGIIAKKSDGTSLKGTAMPEGHTDINIQPITKDDKKLRYAIWIITDTGIDIRKNVESTEF